MNSLPARSGIFPALAAVLLAGCSKPAPEAGEASPASEAGSPAEPAATDAPVAAQTIPEALRGRWGITEADCDAARSDAKGVMVVSADSLEFYESVARLGRVDSLSKVGVGATFEFTGEGQEWQSNMVLSVSPDSKILTRTDRGPDALPEPLTYQRCPE